jgi:hypothetical protein
MSINTQWLTGLVYLLTVHYYFYIPNKTVDDLEGLRCCDSSFVQGESV